MSVGESCRRFGLRDALPRRSMAVGAVAAMAATFAVVPVLTADIPLAKRRSTYDQMSAETKAMQDEDTVNPATLWVLDGEALWRAKAGAATRACAECHGEAPQSMKGVAARYPAYDDKHKAPVDLEGRINICRTEHQQAPALAFEGKDLLALTAYIARQSRGLPIESTDERLAPFIAAGHVIFSRRQGQLNLACAQCHDDNWGQKLAGIVIPQGHPTGYPLYRLEWQTLGSLQRRLRNCLIGMRAEPYAYGAPEYVALETFLMWRARGMMMESPAVRP
jgi:L-cysteine S-thiosulfotransferase